MKKLLFILCVSFIIGSTFAIETENNIKESTSIELASNSSKAYFAKRCCRRTVTNDNGDSWSVRRCVTHGDGNIAMGRACEMAAHDANTAMQQATSYTLTVVD
ncbi:hypothetical protein [Psychroserpens sp.]